MKTLRLILVLVILLLALLADKCFGNGYEFELKTVFPDSLTSNHANQCNPNCAQQSNGGNGFILTYKDGDKWINVGIGRITGVNSYDDPLKVDFLQLANAELELWRLRLGVAVWKMWIYGYKNNDKDIIQDVPPWAVFHLSYDFYRRGPATLVYQLYDIELPMVQINLATINLRYEF